jgi:hypothetical protein
MAPSSTGCLVNPLTINRQNKQGLESKSECKTRLKRGYAPNIGYHWGKDQSRPLKLVVLAIREPGQAAVQHI